MYKELEPSLGTMVTMFEPAIRVALGNCVTSVPRNIVLELVSGTKDGEILSSPVIA